jgi:hypothetical protein
MTKNFRGFTAVSIRVELKDKLEKMKGIYPYSDLIEKMIKLYEEQGGKK